MRDILVATDFSPAGDNAAYYAAALAESHGCSLVVLHAYFMPVTFNDPAIPIIPVTDLKETNQARMDSLSTGLRQSFPGLTGFSARVEYGDIEDILEDMIGELKPQLLVIGTHAEAEESFFIGSRSGELLRSSKTAMLAVPEGYRYKPVEKLCMGVDKNGIPADAAFETLQELLAANTASLDILHIAREEEREDAGPDIPLPAFSGVAEVRLKVISTSGNVDDEIAAFITASGTDWLAVIPHHYSFWESLFHKSHTKALVHKAGIPVLALH